jgi:hypothetical protein
MAVSVQVVDASTVWLAAGPARESGTSSWRIYGRGHSRRRRSGPMPSSWRTSPGSSTSGTSRWERSSRWTSSPGSTGRARAHTLAGEDGAARATQRRTRHDQPQGRRGARVLRVPGHEQGLCSEPGPRTAAWPGTAVHRPRHAARPSAHQACAGPPTWDWNRVASPTSAWAARCTLRCSAQTGRLQEDTP